MKLDPQKVVMYSLDWEDLQEMADKANVELPEDEDETAALADRVEEHVTKIVEVYLTYLFDWEKK